MNGSDHVAEFWPENTFQRTRLRPDHMHLEAALAQRRCGLEADKAGADHRDTFSSLGLVDQCDAVIECAQVA